MVACVHGAMGGASTERSDKRRSAVCMGQGQGGAHGLPSTMTQIPGSFWRDRSVRRRNRTSWEFVEVIAWEKLGKGSRHRA